MTSIYDPHYFTRSRCDRDSNRNLMNHVNDLFIGTGTACSLFDREKYMEAGKTLLKATAGIEGIVRAEHSSIMAELPILLYDLVAVGRQEIASAILKSFTAFARLLLGQAHPLYQFTFKLYGMAPRDLQDLMIAVMELNFSFCPRLVGPLNYPTVLLRLTKLPLGGMRMRTDDGLKGLAEECKISLARSDPWAIMGLIRLSWFYLNTGQFQEGALAAQKLIDELQQKDQTRISMEASLGTASALACLARCLIMLGDSDRAIETSKAAMKIYEHAGLEFHAYDELCLLEEQLQGLGRSSEAAAITDLRQRFLNLLV